MLSSRTAPPAPQRPLRIGPAACSLGTHLVVVLSYGDPTRAITCARSIRDGSGSRTHHILVVRNHSDTAPGDLPGVVAGLPDADLISLETNRGFSGGMNVGLQWGLDRGFETLTVLNDDTVASGQAFDRLAGLTQQEPGRAVCPRIEYLPPGPDPWFVGATSDPTDALPRHLTTAEFAQLPRCPDGTVEVDLVTGCCVTASADAWLATGGFDERYFLYFEDSDWSLRARDVGVRLCVDDRVSIRHAVSASSVGHAAYLTTFYYSRNLLMFGYTWPTSGRSVWRMWWRRSLKPAARAVKRDRRKAASQTAMVALGGAAWAGRKLGCAPAGVVRLADRLSRTRRTTPSVR